MENQLKTQKRRFRFTHKIGNIQNLWNHQIYANNLVINSKVVIVFINQNIQSKLMENQLITPKFKHKYTRKILIKHKNRFKTDKNKQLKLSN